jgi:hypothetical protein
MDRYKHYLQDYIKILLEKIDDTVQEEENDFTKGQLIAYYDAITILKQQSIIFGIPLKELGIDEFDEDKILLNRT